MGRTLHLVNFICDLLNFNWPSKSDRETSTIVHKLNIPNARRMPSDDASPSTPTSQNDFFRTNEAQLRTTHDYLQIVE